MKIPALPGFNPEAFEKYFKNTGWLLMARVGSLFIKMLVTTVALPSYLGSANFGTYSYPLVLLAFFTGISTMGTDGLITRQIIQHPEKENELLGSALRIRIITGLLVLPLIYITYFFIAQYAPEAPAATFKQIVLVSFICIIQAVQIIDSFFQAKVKGKMIMIVQVGGNILSAAIKLILILLKAPLDAFIWTLVIDVLILQIGYLALYRKLGHHISKWKYDATTAKELIKQGWPLAFSSLFITFYMKIDQLMIDAILGKSALGVYTVVVNFSESWYFIPVAISTSLFPAIMNARKGSPELYQKRLGNLYELMVFVSVSVALVVTFLAPFIFKYYKPEYAPGLHTLQVHIWAGVFTFLGTASAQYLIAEGLTKITLYRTAFGAIVNVVLNYFFIPKFGIIGAAYATLIAYFASTFFLLFIKRTRPNAILMIKSLFLLGLLSTIKERFLKINR
ncbi:MULTISPECIES: flippase [Sphingobacterium]|jgi:O-antigen/teichoic acid export membrane protein|uniref:Flippase n=1 Tax=Sphingobacterium anhuiense TaxID=493780 RepID=A0ABW5Z0J7_9SPHI|nr:MULTISPECIES: flippase [unclassified Sphingobacterium]KKX49036.1 polysaccharide biosynthesis protein [Sphingobacterium sp. IITKGP-BTPF85]MBB2954253.1 O-antigen/teichoic acid export membrane protein [Sphingobacterium sp. JUb56]MCS3555728.1 O-antigen/teichoic acid export membrane protein [Sphingobacterium sp. JUb21]TCR00819.1 O-antigen/teichoic acid export membrane protein [Sphingobacterium sp. JUb20]